MAWHNCEQCAFRARFDKNPASLLGRVWRWHAGWCPGWKAYMSALPPEKRMELARHYDLPRYKADPDL